MAPQRTPGPHDVATARLTVATSVRSPADATGLLA